MRFIGMALTFLFAALISHRTGDMVVNLFVMGVVTGTVIYVHGAEAARERRERGRGW